MRRRSRVVATRSGPNIRGLLLVAMCSTQFLNVASISSVNIALPDIADSLNFSPATLPWVVSAYLLTFAGFLLVSGRAADLLGRRKVLVTGFVVFAVCAAVNALAVNAEMLIAGRAVQGIGAAASIPASLGILTSTFTEPAARSRAVAAFGAAGAVGYASGLVLGGIVTGPLGWRWTFGLTVPPALILIAVILLVVVADPGREPGGARVDVLGAVTSTTGLLAIVFALTNAGSAGWAATSTLATLIGGIVLLGAFALVQKTARHPLIPAGVWRRPDVVAIVVIGFCLFAAWVGTGFFLSLTLQRVLGYSAIEAALALLPLAVGGMVFATLAGRLLPRTGTKTMLVGGLTVYSAGIVLMTGFTGDTEYWPHVFVAIMLAVAGNALTYVASNVAALAHAPLGEQSVVGGLFNTALQLGGGLGLAIMGLAAATHTAAGASPEDLLAGYRVAFGTAALIAVAGLTVATLFLRSGSSPSVKART